jgi:hypothetical protein
VILTRHSGALLQSYLQHTFPNPGQLSFVARIRESKETGLKSNLGELPAKDERILCLTIHVARVRGLVSLF